MPESSAAQGQLGPDFHQRDEDNIDASREHPAASPLRIAYADPPYPGCAHLYKGHADYAGEVDHKELIDRLEAEYDGYILHTSSVALGHVSRRARLGWDTWGDEALHGTELIA